MSSMTPPPADEPIMATPISSAPPPFIPVQLDPTKDSGKDVEGTSAVPEKTSEAEKKAEEMAAKKSKARQRDSESKGKWWPCTTTNIELQNLEGEGFLQPGSWRATPNALAPAPQDNEMVLTKALVERGFSFPPSDFFLEILKAYGLQPHNISPNNVLAISNHVTLCEGHLRVTPELSLFQYYFTVKKERIRQSSELATCGTITFMIRPGRVYPHTDRHESARYWSAGFFYLKDVSDPANARKLPPFKNCPATELPTWSHCPHISESLQRAPRGSSDGRGLTGKDLTLSWFTKRIQPLQHRDRLMFQYIGRDDPMRVTKDNLSADALDKRIRLLIKVPRELHVHVCNKDIHMNGSGTAKTTSELFSEFLPPETRIRMPRRRRKLPRPPAPRRGRRPLLPAPMQNAPAKCLACCYRSGGGKEAPFTIDTSNKGQPDVQHFFKPSGSGSQPPKAPRAPKKKAKPSPASFPVTPEVEVPPKASSASKPDPKDIINVDDLPEDPAHHGDSAKGTSSPRHAEVSDMLNKVWGKPDEEVRELADLEDNLKEFFAKHREVRQTTRKLHEDLRVHVLEQITEIEGLRQNAENSQQTIRLLESRLQEETAKHSKFDELSAKVQVLEAENEFLKDFVKKSASQENQARKELIEKHARDLAELNEKLEKSQGRVISVISKNKVLEAEAEAIDKLIFPSLGFEWSKESNLKRTEAYNEARISIDALFEACRGIAKTLSLKKAKTTVIDTMTKLMQQVPDFIKDGKSLQHASRLPSPGHLQGSLPRSTGGCCTRSPRIPTWVPSSRRPRL
ncbi:hypothetical protein QYE76_070866 [Lolium multiflorum]|uniref:Transposase (putative) gypsy type domain-containing protein n=1 Tax=Lolium multiflorum TaxID=4521 RepID=A0AAD8SJ02_LOLMU|nr:hypothetical protein QYE76_070866 [Lolium multiflorum]